MSHIDRHAREATKAVIGGGAAGVMITKGDLSLFPGLVYSLIVMGTVIALFEMSERLYGRPEELQTDRGPFVRRRRR